jgi:GntR family transcriptional regulator
MPDVPIHGDGTQPIYVQLENLVRERIGSGEWAPGMMLPSERQLGSSFGIARMTVRQALTRLVTEGLLTRAQGRGTFVARPRLRQSLTKLTSFSEDMRDRGMLGTTRLLSQRQLPASLEIAVLLAVPVGSPVLQLQRLRSANGYPIAIEYSSVRGDICGPIVDDDLERQSLYRLLEERCGVHMLRASQEIEAGAAAESEARLLNVSPGVPVLRMLRRTLGEWQGQELLCEVVHSVYRGDRYRFYVELER